MRDGDAGFFSKLENAIRKKDSLLCVGLDPETRMVDDITGINKRIIRETLEFTACYKPNIAFYEVHGPEGIRMLVETLAMIPPDVPVIIDAKRSDIGNTARMYAREFFEYLKADAVTVNPYLGKEAVQPFTDYAGKGVFVLARTTNPGAGVIQGLMVRDPDSSGFSPLYMKIAEEVAGWAPNIGLVVAGNNPEVLKKIRERLPETWFLSPGIGAQGGTVEEAVLAGARVDGSGILLNVSRSISNAVSPGKAAENLWEAVRKARQERPSKN
ncbi:MAG: orotidine-5'-phosphate decarboxylase [Spirochaetales bacterium]|nr:orotidine-5'-phosphate decarboxylase [Spirochaetales bacterium]